MAGRTGEYESSDDDQHRNQRHSSGDQEFGLADDPADPLGKLFFAFVHSGGGFQVMGGGAGVGDHVHKGLAVGNTLLVAQFFQHGFVTGKLAVPLCQSRGDPYQRIEPVDAQAHAAHQRPDVVLVGIVGQLVGQNMAQMGLVLGANGG